MNSSELVSIVVPVYKVERYLSKCMDSILKQSYRKLEIILVDDGSPDNCGVLCDEYSNMDDRVKVIHKENGGLSSARNAGLEIASGKYIFFLDSDDYIEESLITKCVSKLEECSADMVCFNYNRFSESGRVWKSDFFNHQEIIIDSEKKRLQVISNSFFKYRFGFEAWNRMYRTSVIKENNIRFAPNKLIFSEDICFNLCYLLYCNKIEVIEDFLYNYLIRDDSIMGVSKSVIKVQQYTNLAKYVYKNHVFENYIKKNFYIIFMLLLDIQLMRVNVNERNSYSIKDEFYIQNLKEAKKGLVSECRTMGITRGIKANLCARLYLDNSRFSKIVLSRMLK